MEQFGQDEVVKTLPPNIFPVQYEQQQQRQPDFPQQPPMNQNDCQKFQNPLLQPQINAPNGQYANHQFLPQQNQQALYSHQLLQPWNFHAQQPHEQRRFDAVGSNQISSNGLNPISAAAGLNRAHSLQNQIPGSDNNMNNFLPQNNLRQIEQPNLQHFQFYQQQQQQHYQQQYFQQPFASTQQNQLDPQAQQFQNILQFQQQNNPMPQQQGQQFQRCQSSQEFQPQQYLQLIQGQQQPYQHPQLLLETQKKYYQVEQQLPPENHPAEPRNAFYQNFQYEEYRHNYGNPYKQQYFYQLNYGTASPSLITPVTDMLIAPSQNGPESFISKNYASSSDPQRDTLILINQNNQQIPCSNSSPKSNKNNDDASPAEKNKPIGQQNPESSKPNEAQRIRENNQVKINLQNCSLPVEDEEEEEEKEESKIPVQQSPYKENQEHLFSITKNGEGVSEAASNQSTKILKKVSKSEEKQQSIDDISNWWKEMKQNNNLPPIIEICKKIQGFNQDEKWVVVVGEIIQQGILIEEISSYYQRMNSYPENIEEIMKNVADTFSIFFSGSCVIAGLEELFYKYQDIFVHLIEAHDQFMLLEVKDKLDQEFLHFQGKSKIEQIIPIQKKTESLRQTNENKDLVRVSIKEQEQTDQGNRLQQQQNNKQIGQNNQRPLRNDQRNRVEINEEQKWDSGKRAVGSQEYRNSQRTNLKFLDGNQKPFQDDFQNDFSIRVPPRIEIKEIKEQTYMYLHLEKLKNYQKTLSSAAYLANQYYFLREDYYQKIRQLLHCLASKHRTIRVEEFNRDYRKEMNIYYNLRVTNFKFEKTQFVMCLNGYPLFTSQKKAAFSEYNRLKQGQLIILADRAFKKIIFGTVCFVDSQADQTFKGKSRSVQFGIVPQEKLTDYMNSNLKMSFDLAKQSQKQGLYAFEPKGFWGAYSNCLEEIWKMSECQEGLPFSGPILNSPQAENKPTAYPMGNMQHSINYDSLNYSQKTNFQRLLTQNVCLISDSQEYIKNNLISSFVETLLDSWNKWNSNNRPILVVAKKAETVNNFLSYLSRYRQGKYQKQVLLLGKNYESIRDTQQKLLDSWKVVETQKNRATSAFMNYVQSTSLQNDPLEADIMSFKVNSVNILDKLIKDLLEFLHVGDLPVDTIPKEDKLLIFRNWWSNSIDDVMFAEIISRQIRQAGYANQVLAVLKAQHNQFEADSMELEKENSKKKYINRSKKFLDYELEAGYKSDEEVVQRNQDEGTIEEQGMKQIKEVDFWSQNSFQFEDNHELDFKINNTNLVNLSFNELEQIKHKMYLKKQMELMSIFVERMNDFQNAARENNDDMFEFDLDTFKSNRIIGGTVIDAHKYIEALKKSEYQTLIVLDEAEQILEGMLVPLLREELQQLILIGNAEAQPTQLVNNPELDIPLKYKQSLFLRLKNSQSSHHFQEPQVEKTAQNQIRQMPNQSRANNYSENQNNFGNNVNNNNHPQHQQHPLGSEENPLRVDDLSNLNRKRVPQPLSYNPMRNNNSYKDKESKFC